MKKLTIIMAVLMSLAIFASCSPAAAPEEYAGKDGFGSYDYESSAGEDMPGIAPAEAPAYAEPTPAPDMNSDAGITDSNVIGGIEGATPGDSILQPSVNRKIVYNGTIEANTKEFDKDCDMILSTLQDFGGYVESSYISGTKPEDRNDRGRQAQMTLRVPSKKFDIYIYRCLKAWGRTFQAR